MSEVIPYPNIYTYFVNWRHEDQAFVATVAEFPSLSWVGSSPESAVIGLKAVVHETLLDLQQSGGVIPRPHPRPGPPPIPQPGPYAGFPTFPFQAQSAVQQSVNVRVGGGFVRTSHTFHLVMTILSCGFWAPIWAIAAAVNASRNSGR